MPVTHKKIDAILVLLDVVGYTPRSLRAGTIESSRFDAFLAEELTRRAKRCAFERVRSTGDGALFWGRETEALIGLFRDLFIESPVREYQGFEVRLRMLAHKDFFAFRFNDDRVEEVSGPGVILLSRLEKHAPANRILVTPHLYNGLQDELKDADIGAQEIDLPEQLKGLGQDSPRKVYLLTPPLAPSDLDQELPASYREARDKLYQQVQFIPVFAGLYDAIPMGENFLNLSLDLSRSDRGGYLRFTAPDFEPRLGLRRPEGPTAEDDPGKSQFKRDRLTADELYAHVPVGVIAGLPGAGKTTILRHFAWRAFEENPFSVVVFLETRLLDDTHLDSWWKSRSRIRPEDVFPILAAIALYSDKKVAELTPKERGEIDCTAKALQQSWENHRAVLLLDALDEARTSAVRDWLRGAADLLMKKFPTPEQIERDGQLPAGRCYLSLRVAELDMPDPMTPTSCDIFLVNSLDQEQIRAIARRRYGGIDNETYRAFDGQIWRRRDIQRIAGTPLTAMLMVFFFEVERKFARRHATYRLLVLFLLDRAWNKLKCGEFVHRRLDPFFQEVQDPGYLERRPELKAQYTALAYAAQRILYHRDPPTEGEAVATSFLSRRIIDPEELRNLLSTGLQRQRQFLQRNQLNPESFDLAAWIKMGTVEHLFIPVGRSELVFLHSTVLEYLAAEDVADLLRDGKREELAKVFDDRRHDSLDTLPILCSRDLESSHRVLERLGTRQDDTTTALAEASTLPFRCLAELEAVERDNLARFRDIDLRQIKQQEVDGRAEKDWAYRHLRRYVLAPSIKTEADRYKELEKRKSDLGDCIPLCRVTFPLRYLHDWRHSGPPVANAQAQLIQKMLDENAWKQAIAAGFQGNPPTIAFFLEFESAEYLSAGYLELCKQFRGEDFVCRIREEQAVIHQWQNSADELTCDEAGTTTDGNMAYYRVAFSRAIVGAYGSPNFKHGGAVRALAFSPDGRLAVSASDDSKLILWHVNTGREVRTLSGHKESVYSCAFSPDGQRLLSGSADATLKLWDAGSGQEVRTLAGHQGSVYSCVFSPDGRRLLSGSADATLKLWDAESGQEVRTMTGHQGSVLSCVFSPDGRRLLSGAADTTLKLWDAESGHELRTMEGHWGWVHSCDFSPDSRRLLSGAADATLKLWDAESGQEVRTMTGQQGGSLWSCDFSPNGRWLLSGAGDTTLKMWDAESGQEMRTMTGHQGSVLSCVFRRDGRRLLSGSDDFMLKLWDAESGQEVRRVTGHWGSVNSCIFNSDGRWLLSCADDLTLKLWDTESGQEVRTLSAHKGKVLTCAFSPDSRRLLSGGSFATLKLWDTESGQEIRTLSGHHGRIFSCAFSPDGRRLLSGAEDDTLKLWDVESGQEVRTLVGHGRSVHSCVFSPDGRWLLSGADDTTLKLWNVESGEQVRTLSGHTGSVYSCVFSPDGRRLLSGSKDRTLKLWDAESGQEIGRPLTGHKGGVQSCAFSPDGRRLLSGATDAMLKLWDANSGRQLCSWNLGWPVRAICVHPQRPNLVVAALTNGILILVDTDVRDPQR